MDLKVIMIGMCPYHTAKNGIPVADGLLMGCSKTGILQPSLDKFYDGLKIEFDKQELDIVRNPNVAYLAKGGVLMLNAALTTEINKAGSLIEYLFEHVFQYEDAPIIFLGKDAARYKKLVGPMKWSFVLPHPASAAYKQSDWDTEGVFTKVNKLIKEYNNYEIQWLDIMPF
jgi:uracil DNA glycosylase